MRKAALALIVLISALIFPTIYTIPPLPGDAHVARATPLLSGAKPMEVPNGTFSGVGLALITTASKSASKSHKFTNVP